MLRGSRACGTWVAGLLGPSVKPLGEHSYRIARSSDRVLLGRQRDWRAPLLRAAPVVIASTSRPEVLRPRALGLKMSRVRTFGQSILAFAKSIDLVAKGTFDQVLDDTEKRLAKSELSLGALIVPMLITRAGEQSLAVRWPKGDWWELESLKKDRRWNGHASMVVDTNRGAWLVARKRGALLSRATTGFKDLSGNHTRGIPKYAQPPTVSNTRTSVIIPIRDDQKLAYGAVNYELSRRAEYSQLWAEELGCIADAIGILYRKYQSFETTTGHSEEALATLRQYPHDEVHAAVRVFLSHGHNEERKREVVAFIEEVGLEAVVLANQPGVGKTIIELFEKTPAAFAVVLITADDIGAKLGETGKPRARQNVILELGYFYGTLGRDRVLILREDGVEMPSQVDGVRQENLDGDWRAHLRAALEAAGMLPRHSAGPNPSA